MNLFSGMFGTLPHSLIYLRLSLLLALGWICVGSAKAADENSPLFHEAALHSAPNTEAEWIVQSITGEIARLAAYAAKLDDGTFPPDAVKVATLPRNAAGFHYAIELRLPKREPLRKSIDIPGAIWDPESYAPLARDLFAQMGLDKQKQLGAIGGNPLTALTTPHAQIIQQENHRISQWLTLRPLDAAAHEQAALLLGTLGMRENCGSFWDTHGFCNHATAHLAIARALRSGEAQSDSGAVGELLIGLLMDTKSDCEKRIAVLESRIATTPELKPWTVAAILRNRRDYRIVADPAQGTLLERIELFRALGEAAGPQAACKTMANSLKEPLADWTRILLQFSFTVDEGHQFTQAALPFEITEAGKIFPELLRSKMSADTLAKSLNRESGHIVNAGADGLLSVNVIDDGAWAMFFQRHLCHVVSRSFYFMNSVWGVPDSAREFKSSISTLFQKLTLFPLTSVDTGDMAWISEQAAAVHALVKSHPEQITDGIWGRIPQSREGAEADGTHTLQDWFAPGLPPGAAYCFWTRSYYLNDVKNMTEAEAKRCYEIAPWHFGVAKKYLAARSGEAPSAAEFKEVLGKYLDYYQAAILEYARLVKGNPAEYVFITKRLAVHDPGYFIELGNYFADHGSEKEAVEAFENAFSHQADSVQLSNGCEWLVDYYACHNRTDRALEIAAFAADVYSEAGLETMARLMERLDRPKDAEAYYLKIQERYGRSLLDGFHQRELSKPPNLKFDGGFSHVDKSLFPAKPHSVVVSDFSAPPEHGAVVPSDNDTLATVGLKASDVIVAIDGKQVDNSRQYDFILALTNSDEMNLIVFRDGKYKAIHATAPNRRLGVVMEDYHR